MFQWRKNAGDGPSETIEPTTLPTTPYAAVISTTVKHARTTTQDWINAVQLVLRDELWCSRPQAGSSSHGPTELVLEQHKLFVHDFVTWVEERLCF